MSIVEDIGFDPGHCHLGVSVAVTSYTCRFHFIYDGKGSLISLSQRLSNTPLMP